LAPLELMFLHGATKGEVVRALVLGRARWSVGKPYAAELERLPETYSWCLAASVSELGDWIRNSADGPLLVIGSGGSFTSASFSEFLHQVCTGRIAKALTPLEAVHSPLDLRHTNVLIMTAGGKNPDIIGAFSRLVEREPRSLGVLCTRGRTPLTRLASRTGRTRIFDFDIPSGKDGYLATNSLIATITLVVRAYESAGLTRPVLPDAFLALLPGRVTPAVFTRGLAVKAQPLWTRRTLIVLHTPATQAAAVDLEARFSEAALGSVQVADYRNFAHGRHYWLAVRGNETGIVAFVTREVTDLADRTLRLVPEEVPTLRIDLPEEGALASLSAVLHSLYLAQLAGDATGVDPGRPSVPDFGRRLYRIQAFRRPPKHDAPLPAAETIAIERKARTTIRSLESRGELERWRSAYRHFRSNLLSLSSAPFRNSFKINDLRK